MIVFDIETAPKREIRFDESKVKVGNLKDPGKIREKIEAAREEELGKAGLYAATGYVLAIGYYATETDRFVCSSGSESQLLAEFWSKFEQCREQRRSMVGLNIEDFDLPFLVRRSWVHSIAIPAGLIAKHRYWDSTFVDIRKIWLCGQWGGGTKSSFDHLAEAFGLDGKPEGIDGGDFARLWVEDRQAAIAYLENDCRGTAAIAAKMGVR